jgi:hypothetical protein
MDVRRIAEEKSILSRPHHEGASQKVVTVGTPPKIKEERVSEFGFTPEVEDLAKNYSDIVRGVRIDKMEPKIKVGSALSSLAFFYERVRNTVEYKQDHTLLRSAIERVSKRLLWENPSRAIDTSVLAEVLVKELIWAKYIPNDSLPKSYLKPISKVFSKCLQVLSMVPAGRQKISSSCSWRDWIFGISAGEIEEIIKPGIARNDILTEEITNWFIKRYNWEDHSVDERLKFMYIWASTYRSTFKSDLPSLRYHMIKRFFPEWIAAGPQEINRLMGDFVGIARRIEACINSKEHAKLCRILQKHTPSFLILSDIVEKEGALDILKNKDEFVSEIVDVCERKYDQIKGRVARGITRSIVYIFLTKIILALVVEIPYEVVILGGLRWVPIIINMTLPPFLMFIVGLMIRKPGIDNTRNITDKILDFSYGGSEKKININLIEEKRKGFAYNTFGVFYSVFFVAIFTLISMGLYELKFSIVSAGIFFMFLSLILLFGFRVKHSASEFNVVGEDEGFMANLFYILTLPFLNVGSWLSSQLVKINFLMAILDFLIEAPLKSVLSILEEWNIFMKEKKDDIVDVPSS